MIWRSSAKRDFEAESHEASMEFGKQSGRLQAANLRFMRLVALNAALDLEAAGLAATHLRRYAEGLNMAAEMSAPFDHPSVRNAHISETEER